jgi:hypothetical protein
MICWPRDRRASIRYAAEQAMPGDQALPDDRRPTPKPVDGILVALATAAAAEECVCRVLEDQALPSPRPGRGH